MLDTRAIVVRIDGQYALYLAPVARRLTGARFIAPFVGNGTGRDKLRLCVFNL